MLLLFGGLAILCGLLLLGYVFVNADPARLARSLKWAGIGAAVLAVAALAISGWLFLFIAPLAALFPLLRRIGPWWHGFRSPGSTATGKVSVVETETLRMTLDHDTGSMSGTVLNGRFAGMQLEELELADRLTLLRECRARDEQAARLLEAYLDRVTPNWRDYFGPRPAGGKAGAGRASNDRAGNGRASGDHAGASDDSGERTGRSGTGSNEISVSEAYAILGLAPGATTAAIKQAHRHLMKKFHPDHGGSDYFAARLNRARDLLLNR